MFFVLRMDQMLFIYKDCINKKKNIIERVLMQANKSFNIFGTLLQNLLYFYIYCVIYYNIYIYINIL